MKHTNPVRLGIVVLLLMSVGFASDISATFSPNSATIQQGNEADFNFSIRNSGNVQKEIRISLTGIPTWIRVSSDRALIPAGATRTIGFHFSNSATPDSYIYTVDLYDDNTKVWNGYLIINVLGEKKIPPAMEEIKYIKMRAQNAVNPGDTIILNIEVPENLVPSNAEITLMKDNKEVSKLSESLDKTKKSFTLKVPESEKAGTYTLRVHLQGKGISNETSIEVTELTKAEIQSETRRKLLGREVVFTAKNLGNIVNEGYVTTDINFFDRPLIEASPAPEITRNGLKYTLSWKYKVQSGESHVVASYSVDYMPYTIIGVLLLIAAILVLQKPESVEVKKIFEHVKSEDGGKIKIRLTVINGSDEPIEGVVVKDLLPSIISLKKVYIIKPTRKKQKNGSLLKWELGKLLPGEERIIAYEGVLNFGIIGKLELPKPTVTWNQ